MEYLYKNKLPFKLDSGELINDLELTYHAYGQRNEDDSNIIWVFHAISGDSNVMSWWPGLFGDNNIYNPQTHFIICVNSIGSPYGSTKPKSLDFPVFTIRDIVRAHQLVAKYLAIDQIHTVIGGSFGGYQALEFAYSFSGKIANLILLATSARETAWGIAIHESQRIALKSDQSFGTDGGGLAGMKAARAMAMLTYKTSDSFVKDQTDELEKLDDFKAASYIQYQGDKFVERFDALSYYYLTKSIDSHHIGRDRGGEIMALNEISIPTLVIGFDTDTLVPVHLQKFLVEHLPLSQYKEIQSVCGHDGFLKDTDQIAPIIQKFYKRTTDKNLQTNIKVLKFGGSSLYGKSIRNIGNIVKSTLEICNPIVVVSARGKSTDRLIEMYDLAKKGLDFESLLKNFEFYLKEDIVGIDLSAYILELGTLLNSIKILKSDSQIAFDMVVAFGEIISAYTLVQILNDHQMNATMVDARNVLYFKEGSNIIDIKRSEQATKNRLFQIDQGIIPIVTGYIASDSKGVTKTLGRNGSNFSASLIASFVQASCVENWTDVDGIYSSNPLQVPSAKIIRKMTYHEANEMANFGTTLLHAKTMIPLIQTNIPLSIKNTNAPENAGTTIDKIGGAKGIRAVSSIEDVALVTIEGNELADRIGIDARVFTALQNEGVSIRMISQASSERGIGFVIAEEDKERARIALDFEFKRELSLNQISRITINKDVCIIAIIGKHNFSLEKAIKILRRNKIWMHLITNSISGQHISLVVDQYHCLKAVQLVHNEVFGIGKSLNVIALGKGPVGSTFIDQVISTRRELTNQRGLDVKIVAIADSRKFIFNSQGIQSNWRSKLSEGTEYESIDDINNCIKNAGLINVVLVDNTNAQSIAMKYIDFVKLNYDIVASNKKANTLDIGFYKKLKSQLKKQSRVFNYETNVGAGLPIIDTLKNLVNSADHVTKIRGVFSGSLSYIFNSFSIEELSFIEQIEKAKSMGLTEPNPCDDLSGEDVARKLVILARTLNLELNLEDVETQSLIPSSVSHCTEYESLLAYRDEVNTYYKKIKDSLNENEVLRYIAELLTEEAKLTVRLIKVDKHSPLGQLSGTDTIFEIYTESYGILPMIIQGAGAGANVTARGVYSDVLKLKNQL